MCTVLCTFVYYRVLLAKVCVCVHTPLYIGGVHCTQPSVQYTVLILFVKHRDPPGALIDVKKLVTSSQNFFHPKIEKHD